MGRTERTGRSAPGGNVGLPGRARSTLLAPPRASVARGSCTLLLLVAIALLGSAPPARADDQTPRGHVSVQTFAVERDQDLTGGALAGRLDLSEAISLDAFFSRASVDGERSDLGYGRLNLGDFRVAGGTIGHDQAVHLGYHPELLVELHETLALRTSFDVAVGAGFLGHYRTSGKEQEDKWQEIYPEGIDFYTASIALDVRFVARPHEVLELTVGGYTDVLAAVAPPEAEGGRTTALDRLHPLAPYTHPGLSSSLSEAALGAYGRASLRLLQWRDDDGALSKLNLTYSELWDWIHVDPTYSLLEYSDTLEDYPLQQIPLRSTRRLGLHLTRTAEGAAFSAGVDVQRVEGSTTLEDFGDRDGWSVGARLAGRAGRFYGEAGARYHFDPALVEEYLGEMPRYQVKGKLGAVVYDSGSVGVSIEAGGQVTLADRLGIPRDGQAVSAQLQIAFGGERPGYREALLDREYLYHPARHLRLGSQRSGDGASSGEAGNSRSGAWKERGDQTYDVARDTLGDGFEESYKDPLKDFLRSLSPQETSSLVQEYQRLSKQDGGVDGDDLREALERNGTVRDRFEEAFPGLLDVALDFLEGKGGSALVAGYGRGGIQMGGVRALVPEDRSSPPDPSSPDGDPAEGDDAGQDPNGSSQGTAGATPAPVLPSLGAFVNEHGLEKYTLIVPEDGEYRVLFQGRTQWSRFMRLLLTGR